VSGTVGEWRAVIERELEEMAPPEERPAVEEARGWEGERAPFPVVDSE